MYGLYLFIILFYSIVIKTTSMSQNELIDVVVMLPCLYFIHVIRNDR